MQKSWGCPDDARKILILLAVRVGFEPTEPVKAQRFSRPPDSTSLAPHRILIILVSPITYSNCHQSAISLTARSFASQLLVLSCVPQALRAVAVARSTRYELFHSISRSINPICCSGPGAHVAGFAPGFIVLMSLRPAIPRQVGLHQSPPPLHRLDFILNSPAETVNHPAERGNFRPAK